MFSFTFYSLLFLFFNKVSVVKYFEIVSVICIDLVAL